MHPLLRAFKSWPRLVLWAFLGIIPGACKTTNQDSALLDTQSPRTQPPVYGFKNLNIYVPKSSRDLKELNRQYYPQIYQTTWRASSSSQMPLNRMILAMLGDATRHVESKYFTALKMTWQGKKVPFSVTPETAKAIVTLQASLPRDHASWIEARIVKRLEASVFDDLKKQSIEQLQNRYLNYQSSTYEDFSDIVVYTSTLPYIASYYGPRLIEVNEWQSPVGKGEPRAVDMNYYNSIKNGKWLEDGLPAALSFYWEDSGQMVTPQFIHSTAITGYQIRDKYQPIDRTVTNAWNPIEIIRKKLIGEFKSVKQPYSPIDFAFYKFQVKGQTFVGVFDGAYSDQRPSTCMMRQLSAADLSFSEANFPRQIPYHCFGDKPWLFPTLEKEAAGLIGIVTACGHKTNCADPRQIFALFPRHAAAVLPNEMVASIEAESLYNWEATPEDVTIRYVPVSRFSDPERSI